MKHNVDSQHFPGFEVFIRRLEDSIFRYNRNYMPQAYGFVGMESIKVIESVLNNQVPYVLLGGYEEAFKKRLVIGEDIEPEDYLVCIRAEFNREFLKLTHRDVLGALTNQGIESDQYGDIWVEEEYIYIYTTPEMSEFLIDNLTQINKAHVRFEPLDHFPEQVFHYREKQYVLSSYRLDKVVAACAGKARGKAQNMIRSGLINVNFLTIEDSDHLCHNGDVLSIRGTGRFKIDRETGETKSGNKLVIIRQFI